MIYMPKEVYIFDNKQLVALKAGLAKLLYKDGFDQKRISAVLNLTQPMVSNYIHNSLDVSSNIQEVSRTIAEEIKKKGIMKINSIISFSTIPSDKYFIANENELFTNEKQEVINNLTDAFLILKDKNISRILSEVKINMVMCIKNCKNRNDIASFSNGFLIINDRISMISEITFGKSKHLSELLLYLRSKNNEIGCIMNIKYLNNLNKSKWNVEFLTKSYKLNSVSSKIDILLHKGDFGVEPCSYVIGEDAIDVAKKVIKIEKEVG